MIASDGDVEAGITQVYQSTVNQSPCRISGRICSKVTMQKRRWLIRSFRSKMGRSDLPPPGVAGDMSDFPKRIFTLSHRVVEE